MKSIIMRVGFNAHVHLRKGGMCRLVTPYTARQYGGALVMPNCEPKVRTTAQAISYQNEILAALPPLTDFTVRTPVYLTDTTDPDDLVAGFNAGHVCGVKFYPLGATTGSDSGISLVRNIAHVLRAMEQAGIPLHIHGETIRNADGKDLNPFSGATETFFMGNELMEILYIAPNLNIVYEHLTLPGQAECVNKYANMRATITPMHLGYTQCDYLKVDGKRMWNLPATCLPVLKDPDLVDALWQIVVECIEKYAGGDDSAPHDDKVKASLECGGCSGAFVAPTSIEQYAAIFEKRRRLDLLEKFLTNGWLFQGMQIPERTITLVREDTITPRLVTDGSISVTPFQPGMVLPWKLAEPANEIAITTAQYK